VSVHCELGTQYINVV